MRWKKELWSKWALIWALIYLMDLVRVCTSSMSPVVDVNDLVIRDWNEKAIGILLHLRSRLMKDILPIRRCSTTTLPLRRLNYWPGFKIPKLKSVGELFGQASNNSWSTHTILGKLLDPPPLYSFMIIQLTFVWMLNLEGLAELSRCHILVGLQQFFIRWLVFEDYTCIISYSLLFSQ